MTLFISFLEIINQQSQLLGLVNKTEVFIKLANKFSSLATVDIVPLLEVSGLDTILTVESVVGFIVVPVGEVGLKYKFTRLLCFLLKTSFSGISK